MYISPKQLILILVLFIVGVSLVVFFQKTDLEDTQKVSATNFNQTSDYLEKHPEKRIEQGEEKQSPQNTNTEEGESELTNHVAKLIAETQVKELLKSPSTAKFSSLGETDITYKGENTYQVEGYVDSQNGFGAIIRSYYSIIVLDDNGSIKYKDLSLE